MPVFARTKLMLHEDCLSPAVGSALPGIPYLMMTYTGPNPQRLYDKIKEILFNCPEARPRRNARERFWLG
jgi:hypothetical protein